MESYLQWELAFKKDAKYLIFKNMFDVNNCSV